MKNILRYVAIFTTVIFLAGCAPKDMTKTYFKDVDEKLSVESTLHYKEKSDVVDKQETKTTFKNLGDNKNILKDKFEQDKDKFNANEGVEFKVEENGSDLVVLVSFDYAKTDLNKLVSERLLPEKSLSEDKKAVSLKNVEETMKNLGWEEKK